MTNSAQEVENKKYRNLKRMSHSLYLEGPSIYLHFYANSIR